MDNSLIKDIGRSYVVSSLLPASLFVSLGLIIFRGFIPSIFFPVIFQTDDSLNVGAVFTLLAAWIFWVAFALYSATDWVVRLYEGYYLPKPLKKFLRRSKKKIQKKKTKIIREAIEKKKEYQFEGSNIREYKERYWNAALLQYKKIERFWPVDTKIVMPTRFGNILLTSELYPEEKYAMNSLALWTRLTQVMPGHYKDMLEEKNNHLIFLLNSSLLSYSIGITALVAGLLGVLYQFINSVLSSANFLIQSSFFSRGFELLSPNDYLLLGIAFMVLGYLIYCLAIPASEAFGLIIRSGFDLYRFDLLRQLNYQIPKNIEEERNLWRIISEDIIAGNSLRVKPLSLPYYVRKELLEGSKLDNEKQSVEKEKKRKVIIHKVFSAPPRTIRLNKTNTTFNIFLSKNRKQKQPQSKPRLID